MSISLVPQPPGSPLCGQAAIATIAGVSLEEAIAAVGHPRATATKDVIQGLRKLGLRCADRTRRISRARPEYPPKALLVARKNGEARWHWLVVLDGVIYDPEQQWPKYSGWKITSFLEIY